MNSYASKQTPIRPPLRASLTARKNLFRSYPSLLEGLKLDAPLEASAAGAQRPVSTVGYKQGLDLLL